MGQDEIYLQVLASSGEKHERKNAKKVLKLLERGKHWVLVTLLLSNVITNETLPIVLDRSLGGGWPAVVSSTVLIGTHRPCNVTVTVSNVLQSSSARSSPSRYAFATASPLAQPWHPLSLVSCTSWVLSPGPPPNFSTFYSARTTAPCTRRAD